MKILLSSSTLANARIIHNKAWPILSMAPHGTIFFVEFIDQVQPMVMQPNIVRYVKNGPIALQFVWDHGYGGYL
jgi:hypothetical protein